MILSNKEETNILFYSRIFSYNFGKKFGTRVIGKGKKPKLFMLFFINMKISISENVQFYIFTFGNIIPFIKLYNNENS